MIKGIMPPIATPFINDEIAFDKLGENISKWNKTNLSGYVVFGSNGESVFLTRNEKLKLIEFVQKNKSEDKKLIAGTGSDSIKETISLSNDGAKLGADAALILTPSFYKSQMKHEAFLKYFSAVADNISIPLIIYNVPKFTGVSIEPETVAKLSEHQNIIGIKNSDENIAHLTEIIHLTPPNFLTIVGTASILFAGLSAGAAGGILALANIAANECVQIMEYINQGKLEEAKKLQMNLISVNKAVTSKYGVPGLKAAMDLLGYFGGEPRSPLAPLNLSQKEDLISILKKSKLLN
ncbi:MAG: dihydrodipicolinate synthase family protein [Bacteroidetes bacterium]|nr:dihydrodipicolinate synthase family protein [Bacteroidota bacterium]